MSLSNLIIIFFTVSTRSNISNDQFIEEWAVEENYSTVTKYYYDKFKGKDENQLDYCMNETFMTLHKDQNKNLKYLHVQVSSLRQWTIVSLINYISKNKYMELSNT